MMKKNIYVIVALVGVVFLLAGGLVFWVIKNSPQADISPPVPPVPQRIELPTSDRPPVPPEPRLAGDAQDDGIVNALDINVLLTNWKKTRPEFNLVNAANEEVILLNSLDLSQVIKYWKCIEDSKTKKCPYLYKITGITGTKRFAFIADTHYGNTEGNGSTDDISATNSSLKSLNPDFIFHLGDIADRGETNQFAQAKADFADYVKNTKAENVWFTFGGSHDGYMDKIAPADWKGAKFARDMELYSLWYTIKEGNSVFIFCSIVQGSAGWDLGLSDNDGHFIPQNKLDWLESELKKYQNTQNNIFVISHSQIVDTNADSSPGQWAQMDDPSWQRSSQKLRDLFARYRVDAYIHGHLHMDPDKYDANGRGNVLLKGSNGAATNYIHVPDTNWEHGQERGINSTYPGLMYFDLTEGTKALTIKAIRTDQNSPVSISYNSNKTLAEEIKINLSYPVSALASLNSPDEINYSWGVWEYSDEDDFQWYDLDGLRLNKPGSFYSIFDLGAVKTISKIDVSWNHQGQMTHLFYKSQDGKNWQGPISNLGKLGPTRYLKLKTSVVPNGITKIFAIIPVTN